MASTCQLVQFSDRLFFATFPEPIPGPELNEPKNQPATQIYPASPSRGAAPVSPEDDEQPAPPCYFFTFDDQLVYLSFFEDWGPLNLAMVFKASILIHQLLGDEDLKGHRLVLYSSSDPRRKANAALLLALFLMIVQRRAPWEAFHPIATLEFMPFRDAGRGRSDFNLSITDCLWGVWKAIQNGLCDMNEFQVEEYEFYEKVENGDWNWITPNFIAFASPVEPAWARREKERIRAAGGVVNPTATPGSLPPTPGPASPTSSGLRPRLPQSFINCLDYFQERNIKLVVRLNNPLYDKTLFEERGIEHLELYFDDGSNPTDEIVRKFIQVSDAVIEQGGVVAVHCKAGLGRTGTLIGAYLIWKYGFTANEAIAFMRIVRPGSVVGPQQQYMYMKQLEWSKWAAVDEMRRLQAAAAAAATVPVSPATPPAEEDDDIRMREIAPPVEVKPNVPPVTPSRHVAVTSRLGAGPPQPRKTPMTTKRTAEAAALPEHVSADAEREADDDSSSSPDADEEATLRARATASPAAKPATATSGAGSSKVPAPATKSKPKSITAAARATSNAARERAAKDKEKDSSSGTGGTRVTRARAAATTTTTTSTRSLKAAGSTDSLKAGASSKAIGTTVPTPGRTPRPVGAGRRKTPGSPPGAPPSRLPQLVPSKRSFALSSDVEKQTKTRAGKKAAAAAAGGTSDEPAWVQSENVDRLLERAPTPGSTTGSRPSLRNVRRRRSSIGSVDVNA